MKLMVCNQCGNGNIQQQSWTYINTDKLADWQTTSNFYCEDCGTDEIKIVDQSKFIINKMKNKIKDRKLQLEKDYEMSYEEMRECYLKNSGTFKMYHEDYHIGVSDVEGMESSLLVYLKYLIKDTD